MLRDSQIDFHLEIVKSYENEGAFMASDRERHILFRKFLELIVENSDRANCDQCRSVIDVAAKLLAI